jgi:DNA-binding PadR family transcriptional regulator
VKRKRREVKRVEVTDEQRRQLERLWFIFGNYGPEHTMENHYFIQGFLERGQDERDFNDVAPECLAAVDAVLAVASVPPLDYDAPQPGGR